MKVQVQRTIAMAALTIALAAGVASAAQAERPDNRAGPLGSGAAAVASAAQNVRPNNRSVGLGISATDGVFERAVLRHDAPLRPDDRAGQLGVGNTVAESLSTTSTASAGFRWVDAAGGAGAMLALVLLGTAAALKVQRRGRPILH